MGGWNQFALKFSYGLLQLVVAFSRPFVKNLRKPEATRLSDFVVHVAARRSKGARRNRAIVTTGFVHKASSLQLGNGSRKRPAVQIVRSREQCRVGTRIVFDSKEQP